MSATIATRSFVSHVGAGVPRTFRSPSRSANPSSFRPARDFGKGGPVVYGSYVDELLAIVSGSGGPTQTKYAHSNHLYSIAGLTDNTGAVVERYRYDAYGRRIVLAGDGVTMRAASLYGNQVGFQGRYLDSESGMWYYRTRTYSASLGRFINRMPWRKVRSLSDTEWGYTYNLSVMTNEWKLKFLSALFSQNFGYVQGRMNLYDFENNAPSIYLEPFSLHWPTNPGDGTGTGANNPSILYKTSASTPVGDGTLTWALSGTLVLSAGDIGIRLPNLPVPYDIQVENRLTYTFSPGAGWNVDATLADKHNVFQGGNYVTGSLSATTPVNISIPLGWLNMRDFGFHLDVGAELTGTANCNKGDGHFGAGPVIKAGF